MSKEAMQMALNALETYGAVTEEVYDVIVKLRTALARPDPEPVAWLNKFKDAVSTDPYYRKDKDCTPLYTAPPQREWVGLTDEETEQIADKHWNDPAMFAESIESKLKQKNI